MQDSPNKTVSKPENKDANLVVDNLEQQRLPVSQENETLVVVPEEEKNQDQDQEENDEEEINEDQEEENEEEEEDNDEEPNEEQEEIDKLTLHYKKENPNVYVTSEAAGDDSYICLIKRKVGHSFSITPAKITKSFKLENFSIKKEIEVTNAENWKDILDNPKNAHFVKSLEEVFAVAKEEVKVTIHFNKEENSDVYVTIEEDEDIYLVKRKQSNVFDIEKVKGPVKLEDFPNTAEMPISDADNWPLVLEDKSNVSFVRKLENIFTTRVAKPNATPTKQTETEEKRDIVVETTPKSTPIPTKPAEPEKESNEEENSEEESSEEEKEEVVFTKPSETSTQSTEPGSVNPKDLEGFTNSNTCILTALPPRPEKPAEPERKDEEQKMVVATIHYDKNKTDFYITVEGDKIIYLVKDIGESFSIDSTDATVNLTEFADKERIQITNSNDWDVILDDSKNNHFVDRLNNIFTQVLSPVPPRLDLVGTSAPKREGVKEVVAEKAIKSTETPKKQAELKVEKEEDKIVVTIHHNKDTKSDVYVTLGDDKNTVYSVEYLRGELSINKVDDEIEVDFFSCHDTINIVNADNWDKRLKNSKNAHFVKALEDIFTKVPSVVPVYHNLRPAPQPPKTAPIPKFGLEQKLPERPDLKSLELDRLTQEGFTPISRNGQETILLNKEGVCAVHDARLPAGEVKLKSAVPVDVFLKYLELEQLDQLRHSMTKK